MDLTQKKLTKTEWESIETPVSESEKHILKVIMDGYANISIRFNNNLSMMQVLHMNATDNPGIESYFYKEYFAKEIEKTYTILNDLTTKLAKNKNQEIPAAIVNAKTAITNWMSSTSATSAINMKHLKKADMIRITNMRDNIQTQKASMFEFLLMEFCHNILLSLAQQTTEYGFYLYTLIQFKRTSIRQINNIVTKYVDYIIEYATQHTDPTDVFHRAYEFIEKNHYLLKYDDVSLFAHQKQLFSIFKKPECASKLIFYSAPTGTGKTMSPLGLSQQYRIIFVCVARHVGLALAKSAISMSKKVAFAFGCETSSDIRLHYFAAVNYKVNYKSGGIHKVDNSAGQNVEIMICDVKSYLTAMHYMMAFNDETDIITYWDEPTITMDYKEHELHPVIHRNWVENRISKVVLSCATLPKEHEIHETMADFRMRFENAEIHTITSHDCRKSLAILNKDGKCCLPHNLFSEYNDLLQCVSHCEENKTLLRYLDLQEIIRFIKYINDAGFIIDPYTIRCHFGSITDITMDSIKLYYLEVLKHINASEWSIIYLHCVNTLTCKFPDKVQDNMRKIKSVEMPKHAAQPQMLVRQSSVISESPQQSVASNPAKGILLTTVDAHTLTDGPTIFLVEDVDKIGKFYIQQSRIPDRIFKDIMEKIHDNEVIQKKITVLENTVEDSLGKEIEKDKKMEKETFKKEVKQAIEDISSLQSQIKTVSLDSKYIPNMKHHQQLWIPNGELVDNAFIPNIEESTVKEIMAVDVDNQLKMLLLMGIGVFNNQPNSHYIEIMKKLAQEQRLYMIIAQSDYIYGTNYQFAHGFIGKDLTDNMTQQKTIQALGRIGRNNIQHEYTIRFRDDAIIKKLFLRCTENLEAINMAKIFSTCNM